MCCSVKSRMHRQTAWLLTILIILGGNLGIHTASAQEADRIEIIEINSTDFPTLRVQFEAFDAQNQFVQGLQPGQVRAIEDGQVRQSSALELLQPGVHFIVAYNLSPELSNHQAGVSHYEAMQSALLAWAQTQPAETSDQFSLAANTGMQLIRSEDPREWAAALAGYQPNLLAETPNLNSLTRAVDLAIDANSGSQRKNTVLFITPLIFSWNQEAVTNLTERAANQGIRINIWLVASETASVSSPQIVQSLESLAAQTGGQLFLFSGQTELPNVEFYLQPLRYLYRADFESQAKTTGAHEIQLEIEREGVRLTSNSKPVDIHVEPPNPIFLSPPTLIERKWIKEEGQKDSQLQPGSALVHIVVEFPDGHERSLKSSRLYVDGALAAENGAAPFDEFTWDLSSYTSDGRHMLRVEVEDSLGLVKSSIETPVDLTVEPQKTLPLNALLTSERLLTLGGILAAGLVLALALILSGRQSRSRRQGRLRRANADPLTQPVPARIEPPSQPRKSAAVSSAERTTVPRRPAAEFASAKAWLVRIVENGADATVAARLETTPPVTSAIPLIRRETTIGSDPRRALYRLDSATVSGLHARILLTPEGDYRILDSGSVAGTWVNYGPVPSQGLLLKHGDLVQIGREMFRFQLAQPPEQKPPDIEIIEDQP